MADTYSIYEAKAKFSEVIRKVKHHTEIIVTERGKPVARVLPYKNKAKKCKSLRGSLKGEIKGDIVYFDTSDDWDALKS